MLWAERNLTVSLPMCFLRALWLPLIVAAGGMLARATTARADAAAPVATSALASKQTEEKKDAESPWLLVPTLSSNPKLGTSVGGMAGYMYYFDPQSKVSLFGASAQYTSTGSLIAGLFAKASFGADHHRLLAAVAGGNIKNDYEDFLGTGTPLMSEDHLRFFALRYQYRIWGDWFVGAQAVDTNYEILGQTALDTEILQTLGLTTLSAGGIGANLSLDSRDSEFSPHHGWLVNINNIAYRDWIAGQENYDTYRADLRYYWGHGNGNVLAVRQSNQWTSNAPASAYAPIVLRGYKFGEYLGKYMSSFEAEERLYLAARWTATVFAGIGCLYGGNLTCSDSENVYPDVGAGVQYVIKEKEGMVLNLEYAKGKGDNEGVYLKFGYGF
jgi:Omp85 superfamily domain